MCGDLITGDHTQCPQRESESRNSHKYDVVVQDFVTQWLQAYPCKTENLKETRKSFQTCLDPKEEPKVNHSGTAVEFGEAREDLSWDHCTSTPHRSDTHDVAERAVRRAKEGTSAIPQQAGSDGKWWADSMEWSCCLRNVQDLLSDTS